MFVLSMQLGAQQPPKIIYIYDDLGRLVRVVDTTINDCATYQYDAVGNILSITRSTNCLQAPVVTSLSPTSAAAGAKACITIAGSNLLGATVTSSNPEIFISDTLVTDSSIQACLNISFLSAIGPTQLFISTVGGSLARNFDVTTANPTITAINPATGPPSRLVTIKGSAFSPIASQNLLTFNGLPATVFSSDVFQILAAVPLGLAAGPATVAVSVGGRISNNFPFTVTAPTGTPPVVNAITPNKGSVDGGNVLTLTGNNFTNLTKVFIGNNDVGVVNFIDAQTIEVTTPSGNEGPADVLVTNANGDAFLPAGFTYVAGPPLRVDAVNPAPGSFGVPTNLTIGFLFSVSINPATFNTSSFSLVPCSTTQQISGAFSFDFGNMAAMFKPSADLPANSCFTLSLSQNVESALGLPLDQVFSANFTTSASPDTIAPHVSVNPANGATGLPQNTAIVFAFSEPTNPVTINPVAITISNNGQPVPGAFSFGQGNVVATFRPASNFLPNSNVQITVSAKVTDVAGNSIIGSSGPGSDFLSNFFVGAGADLFPPRVVAVNPPNNATGVHIASSVSVTFSKAIDPASINSNNFRLSIGGNDVPGAISFSGGNSIVTFNPTNLLPELTQVTVNVDQTIRDLNGNALIAPLTSVFTTGSAVDNVRPLVVRVNPADGQQDVAVNSDITVEFSEPMDPTTINAASFPVQVFVPTLGFFQSLVGAYTVSPDGLTATLTPAEPLVPNGFYQVQVNTAARDLAGNPLLGPGGSSAFFSSFTTEESVDVTAPTVVLVSVPSGFNGLAINGQVCVKFSEAIDPTTIDAQTVVLTAGGVVVETDLSLSLMNQVLCVRPENLFPFAQNTTFVLSITQGVTDTAGNALATALNTTFTTGQAQDTVVPTVTATNPTNGASNVAVNTAVEVTFDEAIDATSVHLGSFTVRDSSTFVVVPGSYSFSVDRMQAIFTPAQPLFASRFYRVDLSSGGAPLADLVGNALPFQVFTFTTGTAPGTDLNTLPNSAQVAVNPSSLFADGQNTAQVTISNVTRNGVVMPNGTRIGVSVQPTTFADSAGGTLLGGSPSAADPRFQIVSTLGGGAVLTYRSPVLNDLAPFETRNVVVQVVSLDAQDHPVQFIGSANLSLLPARFAQVSVNPNLLVPDGVSFSEVTVILTDGNSNPVPVGTPFGVTAESIFLSGSAGGTLSGPGCAVSGIDPSFLLCQAGRGGKFTLIYTAPLLALNQFESRSAIIQVAGVNELGEITGFLGSANITLFNNGFHSPLPVVVSISPGNGATGVGLNTVVIAEFSQPLDPATVTSSNFVVFQTSPTCCPTINGTLTVSSGPRGANTVVTFTPFGSLAPNAQHQISISTGIQSATGSPLFQSFSSSFTTGNAADITAPQVVAVNPPDGTIGVALNSVVRAEFSEPVAPSSINTSSFLLLAGAVPVSGQVTVESGVRGPNTLAIFTSDALLASSTTFTVRLTTGVKDSEGNSLAVQFQSVFTTGQAIDNVRPLVVRVNPADGQQDVAVNSDITVEFSEPMDPTTINAASMPVTGFVPQCCSITVAGAYSLSPDGLTATLTPAEPLVPNGFYQVQVNSGARDLAGNPILGPSGSSSFFSSFTTEESIDTTPPVVVAVSPPSGFSGLAINGRVCVKFSEAVDPTTINGQTVVLTAGGITVEAERSLSLMSQVLCVRPANLFPFAQSTTFVLSITQGVTDTAGNALATAFDTTFTTGQVQDTVVPTVSSIVPASGATNVAVNTAVTVTFSEPIDATSVHLGSFTVRDSSTFVVVPGSYSFSADRMQAIFTPAAALFAGHSYRVDLSGGAQLTDLAGNALAFQVFTFSTGTAPGTDLNTLPNSAQVAVNPSSLFANGQNTAQVTISNVSRNGVVLPNGTRIGVSVQPTTFADSAGGTLIGGSPSAADPRFQVVSTLGGGAILTYRSPALNDLAPFETRNVVVQVVSVDAQDRPVQFIGSANLTLFPARFAQISVNPNQLKPDNSCSADVTVNILDGNSVPVPPGTIIGVTANSAFLFGSAGGTLSGSGCAVSSVDPRFLLCRTGQGGSFTITYIPPTLSLGSTESRAAIVEAAGANENEEITGFLGSANITLVNSGFCSPLPVVIPPGVSGVSPASGETGVGLNARVVAEFSQSLNPATVTSSTFQLSFFDNRIGSQQVPGTIVVSDGPRGTNTRVTFTPTNPLPPNEFHIISVTTGIQNANGNPLASFFSSSFSTGLATDDGGPTIAQINPRDGKTDVPLNPIIQIEFSEPMTPASINTTSFFLENSGVPVGGQLTVSNGPNGPNTVATFIPDSTLTPNTNFTIRVTTGVTDTEGNPLASQFTSIFGTAAAADTARPSVVDVNPASGASNVAVTASITVTFSEPVNPLTIHNSSFFITDSSFGTTIPATTSFSAADTIATLTPVSPLLPGRSYIVRVTQDVTDVSGNRLLNSFASSFSVPLAAGTGTLPNGASVLVNPPTLFGNGKLASTVTFSNISVNGTLVANNTVVAVTAEPVFGANSVGGLISGSSIGPSPDTRFLLFQTLGAGVTVFYTPPDLTGIQAGQTRQAVVQLFSVDASGRPTNLIGQGTVTLQGIDNATVVSNPTSLPANGTSTSTLTVTVKDRDGNPVPDGTPVGLTAAPIYNLSTAGGTITDGRTSTSDSRVQIFTTVGGQFTATYRSPTSTGSGFAAIQVLTVDLLDRTTSFVMSSNITLQ